MEQSSETGLLRRKRNCLLQTALALLQLVVQERHFEGCHNNVLRYEIVGSSVRIQVKQTAVSR
jgi:hypothetical protein